MSTYEEELAAVPDAVGGRTDTDDEYLFGGKADRLLNLKNAQIEQHGFESGFDTDEDDKSLPTESSSASSVTSKDSGREGANVRTIVAKKNDSPRYLDVSDKELESYKKIGEKNVIVRDKQYSVSAHVKLTKVDFSFSKPPTTTNR